jgi:hypothetical protein
MSKVTQDTSYLQKITGDKEALECGVDGAFVEVIK